MPTAATSSTARVNNLEFLQTQVDGVDFLSDFNMRGL
jgi:hypothetical protein